MAQCRDIIPKSRVVGGRNAPINLAPWQVLFLSPTVGGDYQCGGSLINKDWVLTAGHCCYTPPISGSKIQIQYGGTNKNYMPFATTASKVVIHPQFNITSVDHDFCLVKLDQPAYQSATVRYATLATGYPHNGTKVIVSGWGLTNGSAPLSFATDLQYAVLSVVDRDTCAQEWASRQSINKVDDTNICAQSSTQSGCAGDSGGPLTVNGELVGVVSYGVNQCPLNYLPNVFGYVPSVRAWIDSTTKPQHNHVTYFPDGSFVIIDPELIDYPGGQYLQLPRVLAKF
ncbi:unnamed protein product [Oppiella nova]|uniref:Peptidase S1 domain-containing protein n=1 Tax=Oppiella nova TaxID=334625 RepID=A0A7R9MD70_9ACAR|nr:unnamed protein product [Oppiella nova]CAG2175020.1 unnamed protein product [Oppiella nova]